MVVRLNLQSRDEQILEHIARYRMTTTDVLHRRFYQGKKLDAVKSTLRRLGDGGYVASASLRPPNHRYYHLTTRAARHLNVHESWARALGEMALPMRYAYLVFSNCHGKPRHLFRPDEFLEEFPSCRAKHVPPEPYYLDDEAGVPRLAYLMTDFGADAGRIIRKCRKIIGQRKQVRGYRELIEQDAFLITVLTARESKKKAILTAYEGVEAFTHPIRVEVLPDLAPMV